MARIVAEVRKNDFARVAAKSRGGFQTAVNNAARRIADQAKAQARVDTGAMKGTTDIYEAGGGQAMVKAPMPYSGYMDQGTRFVPADYWFTSAVDDEAASGKLAIEIAELFDE